MEKQSTNSQDILKKKKKGIKKFSNMHQDYFMTTVTRQWNLSKQTSGTE